MMLCRREGSRLALSSLSNATATSTEKSIAEVVASLENVPPRDRARGEYWWFNTDGTPQRPMRDDEVPF
jgi:hypothetical protein